jgi:hypothetical protein
MKRPINIKSQKAYRVNNKKSLIIGNEKNDPIISTIERQNIDELIKFEINLNQLIKSPLSSQGLLKDLIFFLTQLFI